MAISRGPARDVVGYGPDLPRRTWPGGATLAVSLVINYEEGSERSFAAGDAEQESMTEWGSYPFPDGIRNLAMESMYEFGSRVGVWRILTLLRDMQVKATFFASAQALEMAPRTAAQIALDGHEVCAHGYRWEEVFRLTEAEEREAIARAVRSITETTGRRPVGWYCRLGPSENTRRLLQEEGGFLYDSDSYADEFPYSVEGTESDYLVLPYASDTNDTNLWLADPLAPASQFFEYLKDSFDVLYAESHANPKMMSVGLHCRIIGHPGRIKAVERFIRYVKGFPGVWFATREEVARAWLESSDGNGHGDAAAAASPGPENRRVRGDDIDAELHLDGSSSKILVDSRTIEGARTTVGRATFPPGVTTELINHDVEEVCVVVSGSGVIQADGSSLEVEPGDAVHIPARSWHAVACAGGEPLTMLFVFPSPVHPESIGFAGAVAQEVAD